MKNIGTYFAAGFILLFSGIGILAQSGRDTSSSGGKSNQRPVKSSPTPEPGSVSPVDDSAATVDDTEVIKVDTQLVTIPVRVMDKKGRFVGGLAKENFKVFEDGVEKELALFSNEQQPFTVALVLDMSYSTTFKITEIQSAAIAFIDQLRPQDKVMVISFDEEVHMLCEATNDRQAIYRAIKGTKISTGTSLYEAVDLVMNERLRRIEGRKAIILFTDGVDTTSRRANAMNNTGDAMELDALIYPIRYDTYADVQKMKNGTGIPTTPPIQSPIPQQGSIPIPFPLPTIATPNSRGTSAEDYERAREFLDQLALRTGGTVYLASTTMNLSEGFSKIASELREFYSLGIYPDDVKPGKVRKLKVKVEREGLAVRARETYIVRKKRQR
ncbi:MAG: VWA domain-containing protein [Chloracidobacterium sp.]|nr:VWA domain-containing protein [Chloracidobacterium sp.]